MSTSALAIALGAWTALAGAVVVGPTSIEVTEAIPFAPGSAVLSENAAPLLQELSTALVNNPRFTRVRIEGHTDASGSESRNLRLSERRAGAVRAALVELGIASSRVEAEGFGSARPVASNQTAEGRKKNRRVVIVVLEVRGVSIVAERPPLAKVSARRNAVNASRPAQTDWLDAEVGLGLHKSWRLRTDRASAAGITFRDATSIEMREQSLVIIYGATKRRAKKQPVGHALLQSGALTTRLGELAGEGPLLVETSAAEAEVSSGSTLVRVMDEGQSTISNFVGEPIVIYGKAKKTGKRSRKSVRVKRGYGSKIVRGEAPQAPKKLPEAPVFEGGPNRRTVLPPGDEATLTLSWSAVSSASTYRVELRPIPGEGPATGFATDLEAPSPTVQVPKVPPGAYRATVATMTSDGFESLPSAPITFRVEELTVAGAEKEFAGGEAAPLLPGDELTAPAGVLCALDGGSPSPAVRLGSKTPQRLTCTDEDGAAVASLLLEVVPFSLQVERVKKAQAALAGAADASEPMAILNLELSAAGAELRADDLEVRSRDGQATLQSVAFSDGRLTATVAVQPQADQQTKTVHAQVLYRGLQIDEVAVDLPVDDQPPVLSGATLLERHADRVRVRVLATDDRSGVQYVLVRWAGKEDAEGTYLSRAGAKAFVGDVPLPEATPEALVFLSADKALNPSTPLTLQLPPGEAGSFSVLPWVAVTAALGGSAVLLVGAATLSADALSSFAGGPIVGTAALQVVPLPVDAATVALGEATAAAFAIGVGLALGGTAIALGSVLLESELAE